MIKYEELALAISSPEPPSAETLDMPVALYVSVELKYSTMVSL